MVIKSENTLKEMQDKLNIILEEQNTLNGKIKKMQERFELQQQVHEPQKSRVSAMDIGRR